MVMRPLTFAGDISEIYMGATTEEAPMDNPPNNLKIMNCRMVFESALPMAETRNKTAMMNNIGFRPYLSAGYPDVNEPMMVPINAVAMVNPCIRSDS